jgi:hypothetical protein
MGRIRYFNAMTQRGTVMVPRSLTADASNRARRATANPYLVAIAIAGGFLPRAVFGVIAAVAVGVNLVFVFTSAFSLQPSAFEMSGWSFPSSRVKRSACVARAIFGVAPKTSFNLISDGLTRIRARRPHQHARRVRSP